MPTGSGGLGQQRREPLDPAVDGDVIDVDAAFGEQLLDVAVRQREAQVPADRQHDHVGGKAKAGEGRSADASGAGAANSHGDSLPALGSLTAGATAPAGAPRASATPTDHAARSWPRADTSTSRLTHNPAETLRPGPATSTLEGSLVRSVRSVRSSARPASPTAMAGGAVGSSRGAGPPSRRPASRPALCRGRRRGRGACCCASRSESTLPRRRVGPGQRRRPATRRRPPVPGWRGRRRCGLRAGGGRGLPGWRHAIGPRFVSLVVNRGNSKATQSAGGWREVDVMSRQQRKQRRNAARRPWRRPLVGLGLLAGWLAVSKPGRQAVKVAKEQTSKARQRLAAARPARTTTVAPPTGAPPGPVLAEVTKLPQDKDSGDEKPDTGTETATAEPPTNQ